MNDTQDPSADTTDDSIGATTTGGADDAADAVAGRHEAVHEADTDYTADATDGADGADAADSTGAPDSADAADSADEDEDEGSTSFYVRRSRVPTLGFWVALAIAIPIVVALVVSPFLNFGDLSGVFNFVLVTAVFVGIPLAAVAAGVDAFRHRSSRRRGR